MARSWAFEHAQAAALGARPPTFSVRLKGVDREALGRLGMWSSDACSWCKLSSARASAAATGASAALGSSCWWGGEMVGGWEPLVLLLVVGGGALLPALSELDAAGRLHVAASSDALL